MNDDLKQRSVELLKETGESAFQALLWLLNGLGALAELAARWSLHALDSSIRWLANTGIPAAVTYGRLAIGLAVDFSIVTINFASISAVSIAGFARSAVDSRT